MTTPSRSSATRICVVEDDPGLGELFATWVEERYAASLARDVDTALTAINQDTAAVLLDRRLGSGCGATVVTELRERGYDGPVGMVTAVQPDFDILELPIDGYLMKPVQSSVFHDFIDELLEIGQLQGTDRQLARGRRIRRILETTKRPESLDRSGEYQQFLAELTDLASQGSDNPG